MIWQLEITLHVVIVFKHERGGHIYVAWMKKLPHGDTDIVTHIHDTSLVLMISNDM